MEAAGRRIGADHCQWDGAARLGLFYKKVVKKGMIDALHMRPWKKRWGAVRADCLCHYADEGCTLLKGSLPLAGALAADAVTRLVRLSEIFLA